MTNDLRRQACIWAVKTRISFVALSSLSNYLLPDHSSDEFKAVFPYDDNDHSFASKALNVSLGGLYHWDSQHFLHIAQNGYTYENNLPFFPALPYSLGVLNWVFQRVIPLPSYLSLLLLSTLFNCLFFTLATLSFYDFTYICSRDSFYSFKSALFFCISPATIFFIAPYSETIFASCTFFGLVELYSGNILIALGSFVIASFTRSNGILNAGFFLYYYFAQFILTSIFKKPTEKFLKFLECILKAFAGSALIFLPYILVSWNAYKLFCQSTSEHFSSRIVEYAKKENLVMPGDKSIDWCQWALPLFYNGVQNKYWGVGFLRYYQLKQVPNFLLALPAVLIVYSMSGKFILNNRRALYPPFLPQKPLADHRNSTYKTDLPKAALPFVLHSMFLVSFSLLFVNVQVVTRLVASSTPIMYWAAASFYTVPLVRHRSKNVFPLLVPSLNRSGNWILIYFVTYSVIGTVLFSNGLPWT